MPDPRRYTDQDVQAIIQRALEQHGRARGDLTHTDLLSIGEQVGLPAQALEQAAQAVQEARRSKEATQRVTSSRRRWLAAHAAVFAVINGVLFSINALTTPGEWWFLFSAVLWGLVLAAHSAFALGARVSSQRQEKERLRIETEERVQRPQLRIASAEATDETTVEQSADSAELKRVPR